MNRSFYWLAALLFTSSVLMAQSGDPDIGFGRNGLVATRVLRTPGDTAQATRIIRGPDGSWYGLFSFKNGINSVFKLKPDGQLDRSYGIGGLAEPVSMLAADIAFTPDGKLVMAGTEHPEFLYFNQWREAAMVRYLHNGRLDNSFGKGGKVFFQNDPDDVIVTLAIQSDGKMILGGTSDYDDLPSPFLTRFNADGTYDRSLEANSYFPPELPRTYIRKVVVGQNDQIWILGYWEFYSNGDSIVQFATNLNRDGSFNRTFGNQGTITTPEIYPRGADLVPLSNGGMVLATNTCQCDGPARNLVPKLFRYTPAGTPDSSFGEQGIARLNLGTGTGMVNALFVLPNGKLLASGSTSKGAEAKDEATLWQFMKNGQPDLSYGSQGVQRTGIFNNLDATAPTIAGGLLVSFGKQLKQFTPGGYFDPNWGNKGSQRVILPFGDTRYTSSAVLPDGKLVAAGVIRNGMTYQAAVTRYQTNGSLDTSFDGDGIKLLDLAASVPKPLLARHSVDKLLVTVDQKIIRLRADGGIDSAFGHGGVLTTGIDISDLLVLDDGRFLVTGISYQGERQATVARYTTEGKEDQSFGQKGMTAIPVLEQNFTIDKSIKIGRQKADRFVVLIPAESHYYLARLDNSGNIDPEFGNNGMWRQDVPEFFDAYKAVKLTIQEDGRILTLGNLGEETGAVFEDEVSYYKFDMYPVIGQHLPDGSIKAQTTTQLTSGLKLLNPGPFFDGLNDLQLQQDGRILLTGFTGIGFKTANPLLIRLQPDLQFDSSFGNNGIRIIPVYNEADAFTSAQIYNNDLYVVGYAGYLGTLGTAMRINLTDDNLPPAIRIVQPGNNQVFTAPARISFLAEASDPDSPIRNVFFYLGDKQIHKENKPPYTFNWRNVAPGTYTITAKAVDRYGLVGSSVPVTVEVKAPVAATAPTAEDGTTIGFFPNPATNRMQVSVSGRAIKGMINGTVINGAGVVVQHFRLAPEQPQLTLDVSRLEDGLYVLTLTGEGFRQSRTFIKQ